MGWWQWPVTESWWWCWWCRLAPWYTGFGCIGMSCQRILKCCTDWQTIIRFDFNVTATWQHRWIHFFRFCRSITLNRTETCTKRWRWQIKRRRRIKKTNQTLILWPWLKNYFYADDKLCDQTNTYQLNHFKNLAKYENVVVDNVLYG